MMPTLTPKSRKTMSKKNSPNPEAESESVPSSLRIVCDDSATINLAAAESAGGEASLASQVFDGRLYRRRNAVGRLALSGRC